MDEGLRQNMGMALGKRLSNHQQESEGSVMKYCKDCKWFMPAKAFNELTWSWRSMRFVTGESKAFLFAHCGRPNDNGVRYDLVVGAANVPPSFSESCAISRTSNSNYHCGPNAKWFEPKGA